jgi:hypothetical protein
MNKIEKLISKIVGGEITETKAHKQIDRWIKESYQSGIKTGMIRPKEWQTLCEACGRYMFPQADKKKLTGITVIHGKCPRCNNHAFLIPVRDFMYASGLPGLMMD